MKKNLIILFFAISFFSFGKSNNLRQIEGTKVLLEIPQDFFKSESISGFISEDSLSSIRAFEMTIPFEMEDWFKKQVNILKEQGFEVSQPQKLKYNGFSAIKFYFNEPQSLLENFALLFGEQNLQVSLTCSYPINRKKELENIVLNGKYDKSIILQAKSLIGFTVNTNGTPLKEVSASAVSLRFEERDKNNILKSYLNILKSDKANLEGVDEDDVYIFFADKYWPNGERINKEKYSISQFDGQLKTYHTSKSEGEEFNFLAFVRTDKFDILVFGAVTHKGNIENFKKVIRTISLE